MRIRPEAQHRAGRRRWSLGVFCGVLLPPMAIAVAIYLTAGGGFVRLGLSSNGPAQASPTPAVTAASPASATSPAGTVGSPSPSPSASPRPAAHKRHPRRRPASAPVSPSPSTAATTAPPPSGQTAADQVLALINQARAQAGLPAYSILAGLNSSASAHNARMAGGCGLSHQCPGEPALGTRETDAGVNWTAAGENIGEGGPVADTSAAIAQMAVSLTQDMLNEKPPDDGHRLNILSSSFTSIGIAVTIDSSGTVWMTQDFAN
jgi:uncharacterized protein YkwD